jgi:hypothetical protein
LSDASATSERAEIIRRATALVKPTRAAHPRGAPIRKQFQEDVGHVLDQIELAEENRRVNRAKGSTKPKDVREPFRRVLLRAAQLAREQPGEIFLNWDNPGDIFSGRQNFLWHVEVTLDRLASYKAPRGPHSGSKRRHAAASALFLLDEYCVPADVEKIDSKYCRLAALLTGDPRANLQHHCRERLRRANRGPK